MIKSLTLRKAILAPAMLLLCGIFLQSCTEEMPILKPSDLSGTTSTNSTIVVNVNKSTFTLKNTAPGYAYFATIGIGSGTSASTQYNVNGGNGLKTNAVDFILNFGLDANKKYVLLGSQLDFNEKNYATIYNQTSKAQLSISKIDTIANTTSGSYACYLYNSAASSTDSIYVSGTFNIVK